MDLSSILRYLLFLNLLHLAWQDWKCRSVSLHSLGMLALLGIGMTYYVRDFNDAFFNVAFIGVQISMLILVMSIRNKQFTWVLGMSIGWGDIVFILISAIWMPSLLFLGSYMTGLIGTLLLVLLLKGSKSQSYSIPLVTGLAIAQFLSLLVFL